MHGTVALHSLCNTHEVLKVKIRYVPLSFTLSGINRLGNCWLFKNDVSATAWHQHFWLDCACILKEEREGGRFEYKIHYLL
jgi:hypothetical protein